MKILCSQWLPEVLNPKTSPNAVFTSLRYSAFTIAPCCCCSFVHLFSLPSVLSSATKKHAHAQYTIHLPGENYMLLLYVLWVIIIENQMEVAECEQSTALYTSEFILQLQSAATSSNTCDHFSHPLSFPFPWFKFFFNILSKMSAITFLWTCLNYISLVTLTLSPHCSNWAVLL